VAVESHALKSCGRVAWFEPEQPLAGIAHVRFTTRAGGLSEPPFASLNLGTRLGDVDERVRLNRRAVFTALPRGLRDPVVARQCHGITARPVGELHAGVNWEQEERLLEDTDALVTAAPRLPVVILVADCLPMALVDPVRRVLAAVHAGWRGLDAGVLEAAVALMGRTWGTVAADLAAWLGPCIGACCYQVGPDVARRFPDDLRRDRDDRSRLDLRQAAAGRLRRHGLLAENITGLELCTSCREELFYSHRRSTRAGLRTGRQAMIAWLEPGER